MGKGRPRARFGEAVERAVCVCNIVRDCRAEAVVDGRRLAHAEVVRADHARLPAWRGRAGNAQNGQARRGSEGEGSEAERDFAAGGGGGRASQALAGREMKPQVDP